MRRRDCLQCLTAACLGATMARDVLSAPQSPPLTPPEEIDQRVRKARPLLGGLIPADLKRRLGATHYGGKYQLTGQPYLLEGCHALLRLGMGVAKLWFGNQLPGYAFNSDWKLSPAARLAEVARHPYFVEAFALPFSTFVLEIGPVAPRKCPFPHADDDYADDERQLYELANHFLATYGDREVTFILQHWEGDWMLRGPNKQWQPGGPPDAKQRCAGFTRWLAARQKGVSRARAEARQRRCKVYHAAEVNRVWDLMQGIPTVTSHVLPHVAVDLVSWSSYDGMANPTRTWQGLELIRHYAQPSPVFGKPTVYIGEVGKPEQGESEEKIVEWWDQAMGVFFAQDIPWILHWELYCNEPKDKNRGGNQEMFRAEDLRGFWLIRPDGSLSHSARYLKMLLDHAGGRLR